MNDNADLKMNGSVVLPCWTQSEQICCECESAMLVKRTQTREQYKCPDCGDEWEIDL